ncbi:hypothetical protein M0R45_016124 [Rubus argutus]|uniref:Uncharacterized protein n=1 Tax=Rubus argutus TaxID=59490 RepID=A0AAW1XRT2_RUBAR
MRGSTTASIGGWETGNWAPTADATTSGLKLATAWLGRSVRGKEQQAVKSRDAMVAMGLRWQNTPADWKRSTGMGQRTRARRDSSDRV